jgi:hypothetical protein
MPCPRCLGAAVALECLSTCAQAVLLRRRLCSAGRSHGTRNTEHGASGGGSGPLAPGQIFMSRVRLAMCSRGWMVSCAGELFDRRRDDLGDGSGCRVSGSPGVDSYCK